MTGLPEKTLEQWMLSVERKLDQLARAMDGLVRIEERQMAQSTGMERLNHRAETLEQRLHDLELKVAQGETKSRANEWMIRLVFSGIVGLVSGLAGYLVGR